MITVGRLLTVFAILGFTTVWIIAHPNYRFLLANEPVRDLFNITAALTSLALFVAWGLAVYHWGSRFEGSRKRKQLWGLFVILGVFMGSWFYWFIGARTRPGKASS